MFDGFERKRVNVGDAEINVMLGGEGPALLLLHGYPQTHVIWHAVSPLLEAQFSLVIPDLRGYGDSIGPPPDPEHRNYCKRTMANDMVSVMAEFGHQNFFLAGHDRGARVDEVALARFDALVLRQVMAMKTTFTPGHYRHAEAESLDKQVLAIDQPKLGLLGLVPPTRTTTSDRMALSVTLCPCRSLRHYPGPAWDNGIEPDFQTSNGPKFGEQSKRLRD